LLLNLCGNMWPVWKHYKTRKFRRFAHKQRLYCSYITVILHIFHCTCTKRPHFHFWSKIWDINIVFLHSPRRFLKRRENFGDSHTLKAGMGLLMGLFSWIFSTSWPKMGALGQKSGRVVRCWLPINSFLLSKLLRLCQFWWKLTKPRITTVRVPVDGRTSDANRFYDLSHDIYML